MIRELPCRCPEDERRWADGVCYMCLGQYEEPRRAAVNRLPDYLAAVEALERLMAALDGDGTDDMGAVFAADAALARLREPVA